MICTHKNHNNCPFEIYYQYFAIALQVIINIIELHPGLRLRSARGATSVSLNGEQSCLVYSD